MTILFAPTKLFNNNAQTTNQSTMFMDLTLKIVEEIKKLSKEEFQKMYKLSDKLIDSVYDYYQHFNDHDNYIAFDFYLGESFKSFDFITLNEKDISFLNKHVIILDALYGIIKPLDGIRPYRMDFTIKHTKSQWKKVVEQYFIEQGHQEVLSLASKEFSDLLDKKKFRVYEVSFIDCYEAGCKKVSVFNKQMRGKLLRYIIDHKITQLNLLPKTINGYEMRQAGHNIEYIKHHI